MLFASSLLLTLSVLSGNETDPSWGRFRGPNGSGVVNDFGALPDALGPEDHCIWRTELSAGYSSPVLTKSCVFVTRVDGVDLYSVCMDRFTGEILWETAAPKKLDAPHRNVNSPAASTPVTDGENLYVFFEKCGGLLSYDAEGKLRWSLEIGPFKSPYGMGTSPILAGDQIIMQCDHDAGSFLLAVNKDTGKETWRTDRPGTLHGFSSPILYSPEEGPEQLIVSSSYQAAGYSVENGEKLWWVGGLAWQAKSLPVLHGDKLFVHSWMASPTEFGVRKLTKTWEEALEEMDGDDNQEISKAEAEPLGVERVWFLYDMNADDIIDEEEWGYALSRTSAGNGLYAIQLGGKGELPAEAVLWKFRRSLPNIPSPLIVDDLLYILKEGGILTSIDLEEGESVHSARIEGAQDTYYASPVAADNRIITASQEGRVAIIEAGPEWKILNVREFGEEIWATPAIDDGQVFIRTENALYGFDTSE